MTAILIIAFVVWLFWPEKTRWHPFGGLYNWNRKTGQLKIAVTLPTKKSSVRKRKR